MNIIQKIEATGVKLHNEGKKLVVLGPVNQLSEEQVTWMRRHKHYLMAACQLRAMAPAADQPGLLKWYKDDYQMIADMGLAQLQYLVDDFLSNRDFYTRAKN